MAAEGKFHLRAFFLGQGKRLFVGDQVLVEFVQNSLVVVYLRDGGVDDLQRGHQALPGEGVKADQRDDGGNLSSVKQSEDDKKDKPSEDDALHKVGGELPCDSSEDIEMRELPGVLGVSVEKIGLRACDFGDFDAGEGFAGGAEAVFVGFQSLRTLLLEFDLEVDVQRAVDRSQKGEGAEGDGRIHGKKHEDNNEEYQNIGHRLEEGHEKVCCQLINLRKDVFPKIAAVIEQKEGVGPRKVDGQQPVGEGVVPVEDEARLRPHGEGGDRIGEDDDDDDCNPQRDHKSLGRGEGECVIEVREPFVALDGGRVHDDIDEGENGENARRLREGGKKSREEEKHRLNSFARGEDLVEFAQRRFVLGRPGGGDWNLCAGGVWSCFGHSITPSSRCGNGRACIFCLRGAPALCV